jgi:hypothetical protein
MRNRFVTIVVIAALAAITAAAQGGGGAAAPGEQFVGTWSGTWDGAGSGGGFELTLEKDKDKNVVTGRVSVTGEPTYKATFTSLSFDGTKMTAKYDFPADERAEVLLSAAFDGKTAKGTWSLREKGTTTEAASGGWTVTQK